MTTIEKIRAEIERLLDEYKPIVGGIDETTGAHIILAKLHAFLDTIPEQPAQGLDVTDFCKPIDPGIAKCVADHWWELLDDENAADKKAVKGIVKTAHKEVTRQVKEMVKEQSASEGLEEKDFVEEVRQYYSNNCTWDALKQPMLSIITRCARHFAEWGSEHLCDTTKMIPEVLEEAAHNFALFYDNGTCDGIAQDCFIAGAEWALHKNNKRK